MKQLNMPFGKGGKASMAKLCLLFALIVWFCAHEATAQNITTFAGNGTAAFSGDGGHAASASLDNPSSVAIDAAGNIYIADIFNHRIRKVSVGSGTITTVAGNGTAGFSGDGGPAINASLNEPVGIAIDGAGNLYIADYQNQRVRKINALDGSIATVAGNGSRSYSGDGGPATSAGIGDLYGLAIDKAGNLYLSDWLNNVVRKLNAADGTISTVAGNGKAGAIGDNGPATSARLDGPHGLAFDAADNLYIADAFNNKIRMVSAADGTISTIAGNGRTGNIGNGGPATEASLSFPMGVAVDAAGNVFIADNQNNMVRKVNAADGTITQVAGTVEGFSGDGGPAINASLYFPAGVSVNDAGNVFIADQGNHRIRVVGNTKPQANAISFSVSANATHEGTLTGNDPWGKAVTYAVVTTPGKGTLTITNAETGAFTYTPAAGASGSDSFTYKVNNGTEDSDPATVSITVTPANNAPVAVAQPVSMVVVASCEATTTAKAFNNGSSDPDGDALTYSVSPAGPYPLGVTEVTFTVTDTFGASSSVQTSITVEDHTAPVARTKNLSVRLSQAGTATISASDINNGSSDNCSLASVSIDKANFTCADIGNQVVTLTVVDSQGNSSTATATVTVQKAEQVISFAALTNAMYGDGPNSLNATASAEGDISYIVTGPATVNGNQLTITGIGEVTVTAAMAATGCHEAAEVTRTFQVTKRMLTVQANSQTRTYGEANPTLTYTLSGFAGADTEEVLDVKPSLATAATAESNAGTYPITVAGASDELYDFTYQVGMLTVEKASAEITFADLEQPEDGEPKQVTVTTTPAGLAVILTYNGSETAPTKAGRYEVVATINDINHTGTATATLSVQNPNGIGDEMKVLKGVVLYPNPTTDGKVYLELKKVAFAGGLQVQVYTFSGQLVRHLNATSTDTQQLDLTALPSGLYLVRVTDGASAQTIKVRKQ
ncbi:NHL domain-containing protein [Pontibacter anaerobius]|uniref:MBG domain-containing protein n=1 Tax=Pontibacter anaerobius TaxID=2993940 RepID=A0ABT3RJC4_9BACT|nr:MBG domain-containing protein [Pontibacter anaerobius]MCX2741717.1 MBG domain-containing protein [Pontibacter anaerobius]